MTTAQAADERSSAQPLLGTVSHSLFGTILAMGARVSPRLLAGLGQPVRRLRHAPTQLWSLAGEAPLCAVLDLKDAAAREFFEAARLCWALCDLPILAVVDDPWSEEVQTVLALGAEDFAPRDAPEELAGKIEALLQRRDPPASVPGRQIVLADPDRERRVRLGRHLRRLGLEISFAVEAELPEENLPALVVAHCELPGGAVQAWQRFKTRTGQDIPWIFVGSRTALDAARPAVSSDRNVELHDESQDDSHIIARANGLLFAERSVPRRSPRLPYSTPVRMEGPGLRCRWGVSWNISAEGLYVRTLEPPPTGTSLELELRPPHGRGRVVVSGTAVWRRPYCGQRSYPSGVGFMLSTETSAADRAGFQAGYAALREESRADSIAASRSAGTD